MEEARGSVELTDDDWIEIRRMAGGIREAAREQLEAEQRAAKSAADKRAHQKRLAQEAAEVVQIGEQLWTSVDLERAQRQSRNGCVLTEGGIPVTIVEIREDESCTYRRKGEKPQNGYIGELDFRLMNKADISR